MGQPRARGNTSAAFFIRGENSGPASRAWRAILSGWREGPRHFVAPRHAHKGLRTALRGQYGRTLFLEVIESRALGHILIVRVNDFDAFEHSGHVDTVLTLHALEALAEAKDRETEGIKEGKTVHTRPICTLRPQGVLVRSR